MTHALQTLRQERHRLADHLLELTRVELDDMTGVAGGVLIQLKQEARRQIVEIDTAILALSAPTRRAAA